jgi:hypothetical protein
MMLLARRGRSFNVIGPETPDASPIGAYGQQYLTVLTKRATLKSKRGHFEFRGGPF